MNPLMKSSTAISLFSFLVCQFFLVVILFWIGIKKA